MVLLSDYLEESVAKDVKSFRDAPEQDPHPLINGKRLDFGIIQRAISREFLMLIPDEATTICLVDVRACVRRPFGRILTKYIRNTFKGMANENLPWIDAGLEDIKALMITQYAIDTLLGDFSFALDIRKKSEFASRFAESFNEVTLAAIRCQG